MSDLAAFKKLVREAFAEYRYTEGCLCCRDYDGHEAAAARLAKLLSVKKYADGSGYDFGRYRAKGEPARGE